MLVIVKKFKSLQTRSSETCHYCRLLFIKSLHNLAQIYSELRQATSKLTVKNGPMLKMEENCAPKYLHLLNQLKILCNLFVNLFNKSNYFKTGF